MSSLAEDVRVELYRSFIDNGRAPDLGSLAEAAGISPGAAQEGLRRLAADDVIAFQTGTEEVWLAHPFCAGEGPFDVTSQGRRWNAICIWDALGILALLGIDGAVATRCPDCDEPLTIEVSGGVIEGPPEAVVHYGVPARNWYEDIGYT